MYRLISYQDKYEWEKELSFIENSDVYFTLEYSDLYRERGEGDPYLYIYESNNREKILYPFLKRNISHLPFAQNELEEDLFDISTPYGYGGPVYNIKNKDLIKSFRSSFADFCHNQNIITEFIRFHPLLNNQEELDSFLTMQHVRNTVYVDLTKKEEEIFNNFHKNHQRTIKKACNNNLTVEILPAKEACNAIHDFQRLYRETMDKHHASTYYYFSDSYFANMLNNLTNQTLLSVVSYKSEIIAAAIFMCQGNQMHYHLGCSNRKYLTYGPNHLLFHETMLWGKRRGFKWLHLGGGYQNNDSLFQFKSRFNPDGILPFYIGKKVYHPHIYENLNHLWKKYYSTEIDPEFFPSYRKQIEVVKENE